MDPDLAGRSRETVVKILADQQPTPPTRTLFEAVEFDGLHEDFLLLVSGGKQDSGAACALRA